MNPLHLSGWGVKVRVQNLQLRSELEVPNGRQDGKIGETLVFALNFDSSGLLLVVRMPFSHSLSPEGLLKKVEQVCEF